MRRAGDILRRSGYAGRGRTELPRAANRPGEGRGLRVAVWVGLIDKKCREHVIGLHDSDRVAGGVLFRRHRIAGMPKFHQICPPPVVRRSALLSHLFCLLATVWVCLRQPPDVCAAVSLLPHMLLARLGQLLARARLITWFIGGPDMDVQMASPKWRSRLAPLLRTADCALCMGEHSKSRLVAWGWRPQRVLVARGAYDLSAYRPAVQPPRWDLIYTGHLKHEHKRLDILVEAVHLARKRLPEITCALVGDGPYRAELERMVAQRSLQANVQFLGRRDDVPDLLARARAFIMTSEWEGLPTSLVEAFAAGLPAVMPAVNDVPTLARHEENSLLVRTTDPADYAEAIVRILTEDGLYERLRRAAVRTGDELRSAGQPPHRCAAWDRALGVAFGESNSPT